jgi:glycosyltransferase involved in cell wall biosynthesis
MQPSVSLLTVTQQSRQQSLLILKDLIKDQTYPNILEWILVEGSPAREAALQNAEFIRTLDSRIPIRYIPTEGGLTIGVLRQIANEEARGDIRVVLDDDDYYPCERVEHAVTRLVESKKRLAGCSRMLLFDYQLNKLFQFRSFGLNHSVSSCMAWTRDYPGFYDLLVRFAEESSFTDDFTEPMVQLDPFKTIIQSSHMQNTYSKKALVVPEVTGSVPEPYLSRFQKLFGGQLLSRSESSLPHTPCLLTAT